MQNLVHVPESTVSARKMHLCCSDFFAVAIMLLVLPRRICFAHDSREWSSESHEEQLNHLLRVPPVRSRDPGPTSSIVSFFAATASETLPQPIRRFFAALWALLSSRDVVTQETALQTLTLLELVDPQHRSAANGGRRLVPLQTGSSTKKPSSKKSASENTRSAGDSSTTPEASEADSTQKGSSSDPESTTSTEPEKDSTAASTSETSTDATTSSIAETTQDSTTDTTTEESTTTTESTTETTEKTTTLDATSDTTEKATTLHEALEHDGFPLVHPFLSPVGYSSRSLLRHPDYFSFREPIQVPQVDEYHFMEAPSERGFPPLFRSRPYPTALDYQTAMPLEKQAEYFRSILMEEPSP